jgi:hypothetical protein
VGRTYPAIDERWRDFIAAQHCFFVATAPRDGRYVNVSPKGLDGTFAVLNEATVAYLDLNGSGIETVAHLRENGRVTLMFCAFDGPPKILRLYGTGRVVRPADDGFEELLARFPPCDHVRSVIVGDIDRIQDACGYGVPLMDYRTDRNQLDRWAASKGPEGLAAYRADRNAVSLDGLPGW